MYPRIPSSETIAYRLGEVVKSDRVQLFAGRTLLLLGLYFVVDTSTLGDEPSRLANEKVMACADKLDLQPKIIFNNDMPKECREYAVDFEQTTTNDATPSPALSIQTELPDRESFKHDYLKGPDYDDQVHDIYTYNSLGLLAASGLIYGARAVRRGLAQVDIDRSIKKIKDQEEGKFTIHQDANRIEVISQDQFNTEMEIFLRSFKKDTGEA